MVFTNATLFSTLCGCLISDTLPPFSPTSNIFVVACYYTRNEKKGVHSQVKKHTPTIGLATENCSNSSQSYLSNSIKKLDVKHHCVASQLLFSNAMLADSHAGRSLGACIESRYKRRLESGLHHFSATLELSYTPRHTSFVCAISQEALSHSSL
jgi:hypothetical protein